MSINPLLKDTFLLSGAAIFSRILGLVNRLILSRMIGAEGIGLFQMILPFYGLLSALATLGLPSAVSKIVAERLARGNVKGAEEIKTLSLVLVSASSAIIASALWFNLPSLATHYLPDPRLHIPFKVLPFTIYFTAISAVLRGYFQGKGEMLPSAVSQVSETVVRVGLGLLGAMLLLPYGLEYTIMGLMLGVLSGEIISLVVLILFNMKNQFSTFLTIYQPGRTIKEMFSLALPLVLLRLSGSLTSTIESFLIPSRLKMAGFSSTEATVLFGQLTGMALPLLFLPTVAVIPFNSALLPSISTAASIRQKHQLLRFIKISIGGTMGLGLLTTVIILLFPVTLVCALYDDITVAPLAVHLAPAAPFAFVQITTATILHGMGHPTTALLNDLIGSGITLILIYYLTSLPSLGIMGAIWGYITGYVVIALLDCYLISYYYSML